MCSDSVLAMACSEDSELLATGCKDGTIKVRKSSHPQCCALFCFRDHCDKISFETYFDTI